MDLSRNTFWNKIILLKNRQGVTIGDIATATSEFTIGANAILKYKFSEKIALGAGLGSRFLLIALSKVPVIDGNNSQFVVVKDSKRIRPIIPIEFSIIGKKTIYSIRYEVSILEHSKKNIALGMNDNYGLMYFEIGFKI